MPSRQRTFESIVMGLEQNFLGAFTGPLTKEDQSLRDRIRRALSWMKRAASVSFEDRPPRFVDLWIALNALYGQRNYGEDRSESEFDDFREFVLLFKKIPEGKVMLHQFISKRHIQGQIRGLVKNPYLWREYWEGKMQLLENQMNKNLPKFERAISHKEPEIIFNYLFERLKVLRNQLFHGSSSADTRRNRDALVPGILLLEELLPIFIQVMIKEGSREIWPDIPYPARATPLHPM
ncbi:MAG TPA: HEPN domain-containing protein [Nitrospirales bacterium]|nr:hypothetical protein [Nitrospiraceae bacterium]HNP30675.1 HEPN domain-containing protein [Nitrospirales bacterium]